ncbi:MAG: hypothetical protein ACOYBY_10695 [Dermatophilaceae bacterium]
MTGDRSLRSSWQRRALDPACGVRQVAAPGTPLLLRALLPPAGEVGGGAGGGPGSWQQAGFAAFAMPDALIDTTYPCAGVELHTWTDAAGALLDVDDNPLEIGVPYWLALRITFPDNFHHFLASYDFSSYGLERQDFPFILTLVHPGGTSLGPDVTVWWRIAPINVPGDDYQPMLLPGRDNGIRQGDGTWRLTFWQSEPGSAPVGHASLPKKSMLDLVICLQSSDHIPAGALGIEVRSQVGWRWLLHGPTGHWGQGQDKPYWTWFKQVFCRRCRAIVLVDSPWTTCRQCGATGSLIVNPVQPEYAVVSVPVAI